MIMPYVFWWKKKDAYSETLQPGKMVGQHPHKPFPKCPIFYSWHFIKVFFKIIKKKNKKPPNYSVNIFIKQMWNTQKIY